MFKESDFEDIRPYHDEEINPALRRMITVPVFDKILEFLFPEKDKNQLIGQLEKIQSALDFQKQFMHAVVYSIINKTSKGLSISGFENITPDKSYLFVSNHRDIVLDSAIFQALLVDHGLPTTEITFGSNLMTNQFIIDFGKVNRMFKVYRGTNVRALFKNSQLLSAYIRYTLKHKKNSIWIAQRNGRTKNGNDQTETGLLKMFHMSGTKDFRSSFEELNIVPLSISYEYEPCDFFKVHEINASANGVYQKKPDEDLKSIITGITQPKGHIHFSVCTPANNFLPEITETVYNNQINKLTEFINREIHSNYKLWPTNFIAFDLQHNSDKYRKYYTPEEKDKFLTYMHNGLKAIEGERNTLEQLFLNIYSYPVTNYYQS